MVFDPSQNEGLADAVSNYKWISLTCEISDCPKVDGEPVFLRWCCFGPIPNFRRYLRVQGFYSHFLSHLDLSSSYIVEV